MVGVGETRDVAPGGQQRLGRAHVHARQRHQQLHRHRWRWPLWASSCRAARSPFAREPNCRRSLSISMRPWASSSKPASHSSPAALNRSSSGASTAAWPARCAIGSASRALRRPAARRPVSSRSWRVGRVGLPDLAAGSRSAAVEPARGVDLVGLHLGLRRSPWWPWDWRPRLRPRAAAAHRPRPSSWSWPPGPRGQSGRSTSRAKIPGSGGSSRSGRGGALGRREIDDAGLDDTFMDIEADVAYVGIGHGSSLSCGGKTGGCACLGRPVRSMVDELRPDNGAARLSPEGRDGNYLFELEAQPGGPEGRSHTTAGSWPIAISERPRDHRPLVLVLVNRGVECGGSSASRPQPGILELTMRTGDRSTGAAGPGPWPLFATRFQPRQAGACRRPTGAARGRRVCFVVRIEKG